MQCLCRQLRGEQAEVRKDVMEWAYAQALGHEDGSNGALQLGAAPPKAGLCTVLFNPAYKFIFIKNTKVAGTSVFLNFGGSCDGSQTLARLHVRTLQGPFIIDNRANLQARCTQAEPRCALPVAF